MRRGQGDVEWLERAFHKLALNFTWWVNRKDRAGNNAFEGGFLGLDNIGVFDRSAPLPTGGYLEQADGTAWMALFCQNMVEIAAELAMHRPVYAEMGLKFVEHFLWIAAALMRAGDGVGMWDEEDGFFYDVLRLPDGRAERLKVRSMVGLLPMCAVTVFDGKVLERFPEFRERFRRFLGARPELRAFIHDPVQVGQKGRRLAAVLDETRLRRILATMLDEKEFLSPYGIRAVSRHHEDHPYVFHVGGQEYRVSYLPAESDSGMFGGNSNWRGPIWMPVNALIIRALLQYYMYYGDAFTIECPTGSGRRMTLYQVAEEITRRLSGIFLRDKDGRRPVHGGSPEVPGGSALAGLSPLLRVLPRGQRGRPRREPSDRLDRRRRPRACISSPRARGRSSSSTARRPAPWKWSRRPSSPRGRAPSAGRGAEMDEPRYPSLYQLNTRVWLTERSRALGRAATLDDIPDAELERLAAMGFDWIWLLSVWQTGPAGQRISRSNPEWRHEFAETLPDLQEE